MPSGRKPANLMVMPLVPGAGRPDAPRGMPKEQADIWRALVSAQPDHHFRTSQDLLRLLCSRTVTARKLEAARRKAEAARDWLLVKRLGLALESEEKAMTRLSGVLRLCPRSKLSGEWRSPQHPQHSLVKKPWER
jgi:hypothetical protein